MAGFLLLRRIPVIPEATLSWQSIDVTVVIPARDEAVNLPGLLNSLMQSRPRPAEVIVVDDGSTDATASIAASFGARVLKSTAAPEGWRGKNWACQQGALAAGSETLLFLDADTRFAEGGLARMVAYFRSLPEQSALSLLPFHMTEMPYEELSLFFNLLMAIGAGGFGGLDRARLFGQSMMIGRELYVRAGTHGAVREHVLENLHFAAHLTAIGGEPYTASGRGTLLIRMFPHGIRQLRESWERTFVSGAGTTSPAVLLLSVYWLAAAAGTFLLVLAGAEHRFEAAVLYAAFALQLASLSRQIGTYRLATALLYPIPLAYYFVLFGRSAWLQMSRRQMFWKGRRL